MISWYDHPTSAGLVDDIGKEAPAAKPQTASKPADDGAPAEVKAQRDRASNFYGAESMYGSIKLEGASAQEQSEFRTLASDAGMSHPEAEQLAGLIARYRANPPSVEEAQRWENQAIDTLKRQFGKDAAQALADASALSKRDGRLLKMLVGAGLGSHPRVVVLLAERARNLRSQGKLK